MKNPVNEEAVKHDYAVVNIKIKETSSFFVEYALFPK
jgi:hypothetical protein